MMKLLRFLFVLCLFYFQVSAEIKEIHSISKIEEYVALADEDTLFLFDIDMVLTHTTNPAFQIPNMNRNREWLQERFQELTGEERDLLANLIITQDEPELVEKETLGFLQQLKDKGVKTMALSAALGGHGLAPWRSRALEKLGVSFAWAFPGVERLILDRFPEYLVGKPQYYHGVLISNGEYGPTNKGTVLKEFLEAIGWQPKRIIFLDDKMKNVVAVEMHFPGVEYIGLHYRGADFYPSEILSVEEFSKRWYEIIEKTKQWKIE